LLLILKILLLLLLLLLLIIIIIIHSIGKIKNFLMFKYVVYIVTTVLPCDCHYVQYPLVSEIIIMAWKLTSDSATASQAVRLSPRIMVEFIVL
jgi:hypothetical protein